jgi:hypothetical protein
MPGRWSMLPDMSRRDVRFRPPALAMGPAIRWMLLRAFGPVGAGGERGPDGAGGAAGSAGEWGAGSAAIEALEPPEPLEALAMCRRFEVSSRVAARQGRGRLAAELGAAAAEGFARDQAGDAGRGLRLVALAERVTAVAAPLGLTPIFLKFAALELGGALAPGSRAACDLDVLVASGRAAELQQALAGAGFRASPLPAYEHQLAALESPEGIVEVHRLVLGVRVAGKRSATAEDLAREGLVRPLPALQGRAAAPVPAIAAAHALVHGIAQHGWTPHAYSLLRMVADLVDLGFAGPDGADLASRAAAWIAREVAAIEVKAARRLCVALAAGDDLAGWQESRAPEAILLRHALAGRLDLGYERSLRLAVFRRRPSDAPEAARLVSAVVSAVWISRAQVDALYGPPKGRFGYLARRLGRPFDLMARLLRGSSVRRRRAPEDGDANAR